ncbi:hypothetical protein BAUCODRAFT_149771 [Baudoinia panamericana UAMH 10762]|uniref:Uncharacterized protein n=1 Tax=Baudoinia panamericana (strain UAMH 10762) TaxID=717646 RepID=M2N778_BAUPA|nr:uncharacterized protein BAUCODRAFT_149771 [Baudoinia panamericana UAMH 10762]EMC94645.1 hypothetical protein BAUCODRAFT_149771 [Baudoinia panamericana UAMH 10762]
MYAQGMGYRGPPAAQTATFDAPSNKAGSQAYNEDALPAMPSWSHATDKHVMAEEAEDEDVEMEKLNHPDSQEQRLLPQQQQQQQQQHGYAQQPAYSRQQDVGGDLGAMSANPYHDYDQHQQFVSSPTSTARHSEYPPTYHTRSPTSTVYEPAARAQWGQGYAASIPPSYRTRPDSVASRFPPPQQQQQGTGGIARKPVQGSWRDV